MLGGRLPGGEGPGVGEEGREGTGCAGDLCGLAGR